MASIITPATTMKFGAGSGIGLVTSELLSTSAYTGSTQSRVLGPPRRTLKLVQPTPLTQQEAGEWFSLLGRLRGRSNILAMWDPLRPKPLGTARSTAWTVQLDGAHAKGATSIALKNFSAAGVTLVWGDWLMIDTTAGWGTAELVRVTDQQVTVDATFKVTVNIDVPLRKAHSSGVDCGHGYPKGYFRAASSSWSYNGTGASGQLVEGLALDFIEDFGG